MTSRKQRTPRPASPLPALRRGKRTVKSIDFYRSCRLILNEVFPFRYSVAQISEFFYSFFAKKGKFSLRSSSPHGRDKKCPRRQSCLRGHRNLSMLFSRYRLFPCRGKRLCKLSTAPLPGGPFFCSLRRSVDLYAHPYFLLNAAFPGYCAAFPSSSSIRRS